MNRAEQTRGAKHCSSRGRRYMKRVLKRARRRAERRDPTNAPRRRRGYIPGWVD